MKLGIGSYTYAWSIGTADAMPETPMDACGLLDRAVALGVEVVQYGPNLPLDELPGAQLQRLLERARDHRIEIEVGARGLDLAYLARQVELAKYVGSSILRLSVDGSLEHPIAIGQVAECFVALVPELERNGIRLAIENSLIPSRQLAEMLHAANSPWLDVTFDTVNSMAIPEGPDAVIENLAPYVASVHIKDFQISRAWHRMGFVVEGRPAGAGQLNVPQMLSALRSAQVCANAILELWTPEQSSLAETIALEHQWAQQSISYLRGYIPN